MLRGFLLDIYLNRGHCKDVRHNRIVETHAETHCSASLRYDKQVNWVFRS